MNLPGKFKGPVWPRLLALLVSAGVWAGPPPERTLFKDIPADDPVRSVLRTVLDSRFYSLRDRFAREEWSSEGYRAAWDQARSYFPDMTYLVRPGTYFMTHGYDADGRLFMEVHESAYLALCVENLRTFRPAGIVEEYARMRAASNGVEAGEFREKTGRLESFFRDEKANDGLRRALGGALYGRLLEALREEDYQMLAAGLMHEGLHAGLDGAQAARLQKAFKNGASPVQWDELQAFMAEIGYHARFAGWAAADCGASWARIEAQVKDLERYRRTAALPAGGAKERFDRIRAQAWAYAALVRLRAREIWQSARRMEDLAANFRKDYVAPEVPADLTAALTKLGTSTSAFVMETEKAIRSTEWTLRSLETLFDTWGVWAEGRRPFPPPLTDSQAVLDRSREIRWPAASVSAAAALMRRARQGIGKARTAS
jgi:hypothetical protein